MALWPLLLLLAVASLAGCGGREEDHSTARPVTVLKLDIVNPRDMLSLTGSVETWKQENIGFEVAGRIQYVIDPDTMVQQPPVGEKTTYDENGVPKTEGTIIAYLENERYKLARDEARARAVAAWAQVEALLKEINAVLVAKRAAAEARLERAKRDYERLQKLVAQNAGTEVELYQMKAEYEVAKAAVEEVLATIAAKEAELAAVRAQAKQAEETVKRAQKDLEDCYLIAPFTGQISDVQAIVGGYVQPGQPVATLVVMDPLKVEISVSGETDRKIKYGDYVYIYPPGQDKPIGGWVDRKATSADPQTRTFKVTVIVRNYKVPEELPPQTQLNQMLPEDIDPETLPTTGELWSLMREDESDPSLPLLTEERTLYEDEQGHYVWQVVNGQAGRPYPPVLHLKKVRVELGDKILPILGGLYVFHELSDTGGLTEKDLLAMDVPTDYTDGGYMLLQRKQWLLRPGQIVDTLFQHMQAEPGLFVPMSAIEPQSDNTGHVFVINKENRLDKVEVRLIRAVGQYQAIEAAKPADADKITPGRKIVLKGVHYLQNGERVNILEQEELKL